MSAHTLTPAQTEARKLKQAELFAKLAKMGESERAVLASKMPVINVDGHELSVGNMCLLAFQRADVTVVGGFRQWLSKGRCVRKGEHGLTIRVPISIGSEHKQFGRESEPREGSVFFIGGSVFDVSQTTELPTHSENLPLIAEAREMEGVAA